MNKLWIFGDSNSAPFDTKYDYAKQYFDWKGHMPKLYGEIISEKLGLGYCNLAKPGSDNYTIFQTLCDSVGEMEGGDMVIIGWSSLVRFRLLCKEPNGFQTLIPNWDNNLAGLEHISKETVEEILVNRGEGIGKWREELDSWIHLIDYTMAKKGIKILHWTLFGENIRAHYFNLHQSRCCLIDETGGVVDDYHLGEVGHEVLSKELFRYLTKFKSLV